MSDDELQNMIASLGILQVSRISWEMFLSFEDFMNFNYIVPVSSNNALVMLSTFQPLKENFDPVCDREKITVVEDKIRWVKITIIELY